MAVAGRPVKDTAARRARGRRQADDARVGAHAQRAKLVDEGQPFCLRLGVERGVGASSIDLGDCATRDDVYWSAGIVRRGESTGAMISSTVNR